MKRPVVKQYGLRRSGTNLARALLLANYSVEVLVNKGGHKYDRHHPANFVPHPDLLVTVKHPLHWLYADALGLEPRVEFFEHVTRRLTTNGHDSGVRFEWRDWRSAYTSEMRDRLWEAVDDSLSEKWGYGKDG